MNKIVVLGHSYLLRLSIIRALGVHAYDITVLIVARGKDNVRIDCRSKYVNRVLICPSFDGQTLVKMLLEKCVNEGSKTILIPTSDVTVSMIDRHQDELKDYFLFPHIIDGHGTMTLWMDKSVQKDLATRMGLNVAESWRVDVRNLSFSLPQDIIYPCFVKPQQTIYGGKSFKRCDDEAELRLFIQDIGRKRGNIHLLIERYLTIDKEYAVVGFSDGDDVYIPAVIFLEQVSKSHFGVARLGKVMPIGNLREFMEQLKCYVKAVGFVGLFDIDFFECQGKYYFCELNLRYGASGNALLKMGLNLPIMLAEKLSTGHLQTFPSEITRQAVFLNERICLDDWYRGYLSTNDYKRIKVRADWGFLEDQNDPKPYQAFLGYRRKLKLKRFVKQLLQRNLN